jgi:hypothetical protein
MSRPREPKPAKLVAAILFRDFDVRSKALRALCDSLGPMDFLSEAMPFTYTSYYDKEMGPGIERQVCSFAELVPPVTLPDIKLFTNQLEGRLSANGKRQVNIDPGLLSEERLVLATGKNYTHRIYLRNGIYADLTLIYEKGGYKTLAWTYPDYRDPRLHGFLIALRRKLIFQQRGRLPRNAV